MPRVPADLASRLLQAAQATNAPLAVAATQGREISVVVLEKGGFYRAEEFKTWRESEAFLHTFEKG